MTEFFKSAFGMFGQNAAAGTANAATGPPISSNNDFIGQSIQIGNMRLRVTKMLAEGGYAIVYVVQDIATGTEYALKVIERIYITQCCDSNSEGILYIWLSFK